MSHTRQGEGWEDIVGLLLTSLYEKCPDMDLALLSYPGTNKKTKYNKREDPKPKKEWEDL